MYGFKQEVPLTVEEILKRATQEEIFNIFLKEPIISRQEGVVFYTAPYRDDTTARCYFEEFNGTLMFVDFTQHFHNLDCFNFVQTCLGECTFNDVLLYIDKTLELGISCGTILKEEKYQPKQGKRQFKPIKRDKRIYLAKRIFKNVDAQYWSRYEITFEQLVQDKVQPITTFRGVNRNGEEYTISPIDITYVYEEFESGNVKIYRPTATQPTPRFLTNCNQDDIFNARFFPLEGNVATITKSYKDCRVLRNLGLRNVVGFQNEGMVPSEKVLKEYFSNYKRIVILFDNDQPGRGASIKVKDRLEEVFPDKVIEATSIPINFYNLGAKDPADMVDKGLKKELVNFIKQKELE